MVRNLGGETVRWKELVHNLCFYHGRVHVLARNRPISTRSTRSLVVDFNYLRIRGFDFTDRVSAFNKQANGKQGKNPARIYLRVTWRWTADWPHVWIQEKRRWIIPWNGFFWRKNRINIFI